MAELRHALPVAAGPGRIIFSLQFVILAMVGMLPIFVDGFMRCKNAYVAGIPLPCDLQELHGWQGDLGDGSKVQGAGCDFATENGQKIGSQSDRRKLLGETIVEANHCTRIVMKHRDTHRIQIKPKNSKDLFQQALVRDTSRLQGIHWSTKIKREDTSPPFSLLSDSIVNSEATSARSPNPGVGTLSTRPVQPPVPRSPASDSLNVSQNFEGTVESGVSLGSGEYFIDVFIGTPPKHFSLVIDTGSDLNWLQCTPCQDCYYQEGPKFDPTKSSSYKPITCSDTQCLLVSSGNNEPCSSQKPRECSYFYSYGDSSNTTGNLAMETFYLNTSSGRLFNAENVAFGCGHTNQGLFQGAGGLLGLGRGPLSFSSQILHLHSQKFSYCLVARDSNLSVSSTLTFGEDRVLLSHPDLQYTSFAKNPSRETFYYLQIEKVNVEGEDLSIPSTTWEIDSNGSGGTIIDSGTTLTYFAKPAYEAINTAFQSRIAYPPAVTGILDVCYNITGVSAVHFPSFSITFKDGAVWKLPSENYFINLDDHIVCLAIVGVPSRKLSILGNFLQQNMHIVYDLEQSRLGYAQMECSGLT